MLINLVNNSVESPFQCEQAMLLQKSALRIFTRSDYSSTLMKPSCPQNYSKENTRRNQACMYFPTDFMQP